MPAAYLQWRFHSDERVVARGPLVLIYINDIVENIQSSIRLFADDTSLYILVEDPFDAANQLNEDLQKIHLWAKTWLVTFNPANSESIIFFQEKEINHTILMFLWTKHR